jgi:hypothetical protein
MSVRYQTKGNGFTEFDNERGRVERLLVPFRALADTIHNPNISPHGPPPEPAPDPEQAYSKWDLFGFYPKQHQGFLEGLWEAWRLWQIEGYPPADPETWEFQGYRPEVRNIAAAPGRGMETWTRPDDGVYATVTFEASLKSYLTNLDTGIRRTDNARFLQPKRYLGATTWLLQHLANAEFPVQPTPSLFWPARFWHHLIYAFCIEATNVMAIYRKLIVTASNSEQFSFFHDPSQRWMRNTESLWRMTRGATEIVSDGAGRARRNAYYRMFGLDISKMLNQDLPFEKPEAANTSFVQVFEELLYEVWNAFTNRDNSSGPNTTDPVAIREICRTLHDMLTDRRLYGTLTQPEFAAVAEMSWYYLPLDGNSPIIQDMRTEATTPDERLRRLGEAVGVPAHPKTRSLLKLAERVSLLLIEIEQDVYTNNESVKRLYEGGETTQDMLEIINEWSILVDRDMKAARTAPQGQLTDAKPTPLLGR